MTIVDVAMKTREFQQSLEKERADRMAYFKRLRKAKIEYDRLTESKPFEEWLTEKYGVKVSHDHSGNITDEITVVNDSKYTLFVLKLS